LVAILSSPKVPISGNARWQSRFTSCDRTMRSSWPTWHLRPWESEDLNCA